MPAITRDEVAHLARLARLDLSEDELDHYAVQLDVILASVARVSEVAAAWSGMAIVLAVRLLAMAFRITLPTYSERK